MTVGVLLNYQDKIKETDDFFPEGLSKKLIVNQKGIGAACNKALSMAFEYYRADYCLILANDIVEPQDTVERRLEAFKEDKVGIVTVPMTRQPRYETKLAGNFMISREVFNDIGYFTTEWDHSYGAIDLHYSYRAYLAGYKLINLDPLAKHLDNGDTAYGFSKKQALKETLPQYNRWRRTAKEKLYYGL